MSLILADMKVFAFFIAFAVAAVAGQISLANPCSQPQDVGPCEALVSQYYFNSTSQTCETFFYGGCEGNANRFQSYEDCFKICPGNPCKQEKKVGPCRAAINRYYFDALTQTCKLFSWGGCQANGNNFLTLRDCRRKCVRSAAADVLLAAE